MVSLHSFGPGREARSPEILVVEDSPTDARLIETVILEAEPGCRVYLARDGEEALDFLKRRNQFADAPLPQLIVLDWNLPKTTGDHLLATIKADPQLGHIPVVVLSGEDADDQILRGYQLFASCWVVKGKDFLEGARRLRALVEFWAQTAQLARANPA